MIKTPRRPLPSRSVPMPLWLQAMIEVLLTSLGSWLVVLVLLVIGWGSLGFPGSLGAMLAGSGQLWLAGHGVGLHLDVPASGSTPAVDGLATFTPLGLTVILLLFARRAGKRLARASYEGQFWQALVGGAITYIVIGLALGLVTSTSVLSTSPWASAVVPLWVLLVGMFWGGHKVAGSWLRLVGIDPEKLSERYSQYSRWAGAYLVSLVRAAWVGLLAVLGTGALLTAVSIFFHWNRMIALYQGLHAGVMGDVSVTLLQLAILPNLMIFGMAWGNGAGFALGQGAMVSPAATQAGALPSVPILGAIPAEPTTWAYVVLVFPVLAGALAGWYFIRDGENHLDEWLSLKLAWRWLAAVVSGLILAIGLGILVGLAACIVAALAHGSLGVGRFTDFGPNPLSTGIWTGVTIASGALIGQLVGPWIENDPSTDDHREVRPPADRARRSSGKSPETRTARSRPTSSAGTSRSGASGNRAERDEKKRDVGARASTAKVSREPDDGVSDDEARVPTADRKAEPQGAGVPWAAPSEEREGRDDEALGTSRDDRSTGKDSDEKDVASEASDEAEAAEKAHEPGETQEPEDVQEPERARAPQTPHEVPEKRPVIARPGRRRR